MKKITLCHCLRCLISLSSNHFLAWQQPSSQLFPALHSKCQINSLIPAFIHTIPTNTAENFFLIFESKFWKLSFETNLHSQCWSFPLALFSKQNESIHDLTAASILQNARWHHNTISASTMRIWFW